MTNRMRTEKLALKLVGSCLVQLSWLFFCTCLIYGLFSVSHAENLNFSDRRLSTCIDSPDSGKVRLPDSRLNRNEVCGHNPETSIRVWDSHEVRAYENREDFKTFRRSGEEKNHSNRQEKRVTPGGYRDVINDVSSRQRSTGVISSERHLESQVNYRTQKNGRQTNFGLTRQEEARVNHVSFREQPRENRQFASKHIHEHYDVKRTYDDKKSQKRVFVNHEGRGPSDKRQVVSRDEIVHRNDLDGRERRSVLSYRENDRSKRSADRKELNRHGAMVRGSESSRRARTSVDRFDNQRAFNRQDLRKNGDFARRETILTRRLSDRRFATEGEVRRQNSAYSRQDSISNDRQVYDRRVSAERDVLARQKRMVNYRVSDRRVFDRREIPLQNSKSSRQERVSANQFDDPLLFEKPVFGDNDYFIRNRGTSYKRLNERNIIDNRDIMRQNVAPSRLERIFTESNVFSRSKTTFVEEPKVRRVLDTRKAMKRDAVSPRRKMTLAGRADDQTIFDKENFRETDNLYRRGASSPNRVYERRVFDNQEYRQNITPSRERFSSDTFDNQRKFNKREFRESDVFLRQQRMIADGTADDRRVFDSRDATQQNTVSLRQENILSTRFDKRMMFDKRGVRESDVFSRQEKVSAARAAERRVFDSREYKKRNAVSSRRENTFAARSTDQSMFDDDRDSRENDILPRQERMSADRAAERRLFDSREYKRQSISSTRRDRISRDTLDGQRMFDKRGMRESKNFSRRQGITADRVADDMRVLDNQDAMRQNIASSSRESTSTARYNNRMVFDERGLRASDVFSRRERMSATRAAERRVFERQESQRQNSVSSRRENTFAARLNDRMVFEEPDFREKYIFSRRERMSADRAVERRVLDSREHKRQSTPSTRRDRISQSTFNSQRMFDKRGMRESDVFSRRERMSAERRVFESQESQRQNTVPPRRESNFAARSNSRMVFEKPDSWEKYSFSRQRRMSADRAVERRVLDSRKHERQSTPLTRDRISESTFDGQRFIGSMFNHRYMKENDDFSPRQRMIVDRAGDNRRLFNSRHALRQNSASSRQENIFMGLSDNRSSKRNAVESAEKMRKERLTHARFEEARDSDRRTSHSLKSNEARSRLNRLMGGAVMNTKQARLPEITDLGTEGRMGKKNAATLTNREKTLRVEGRSGSESIQWDKFSHYRSNLGSRTERKLEMKRLTPEVRIINVRGVSPESPSVSESLRTLREIRLNRNWKVGSTSELGVVLMKTSLGSSKNLRGNPSSNHLSLVSARKSTRSVARRENDSQRISTRKDKIASELERNYLVKENARQQMPLLVNLQNLISRENLLTYFTLKRLPNSYHFEHPDKRNVFSHMKVSPGRTTNLNLKTSVISYPAFRRNEESSRDNVFRDFRRVEHKNIMSKSTVSGRYFTDSIGREKWNQFFTRSFSGNFNMDRLAENERWGQLYASAERYLKQSDERRLSNSEIFTRVLRLEQDVRSDTVRLSKNHQQTKMGERKNDSLSTQRRERPLMSRRIVDYQSGRENLNLPANSRLEHSSRLNQAEKTLMSSLKSFTTISKTEVLMSCMSYSLTLMLVLGTIYDKKQLKNFGSVFSSSLSYGAMAELSKLGPILRGYTTFFAENATHLLYT